MRLSEADRTALHRPHAVPINPTYEGCPLCLDYAEAVEEIVDREVAAAKAPLVEKVKRLQDQIARAAMGPGQDRQKAMHAYAARAEAKVAAAKADAWDEGEQAGRDNADDGYPDPVVENPYRAALGEVTDAGPA